MGRCHNCENGTVKCQQINFEYRRPRYSSWSTLSLSRVCERDFFFVISILSSNRAARKQEVHVPNKKVLELSPVWPLSLTLGNHLKQSALDRISTRSFTSGRRKANSPARQSNFRKCTGGAARTACAAKRERMTRNCKKNVRLHAQHQWQVYDHHTHTHTHTNKLWVNLR